MASILLIEANPDNRELTELILTDAGHLVATAKDGIQGLYLAARDQPDVILMDLALPNLDGWAATQRLKTYPATRHIPVVAFTAHVIEEDLERARAAGCVAMVAKPFDIDVLLGTIATVEGLNPAPRR